MGGTAVLHALIFVIPSYLLDGRLSLVRIVAGEEPTSTHHQLNPIGVSWCAVAIGIYGMTLGLLLVRTQGVRWRAAVLTASAAAVLTATYVAAIDPGFLLTILPKELAGQYSDFTRENLPVLYQIYWEWAFWRYFPSFVLTHALGVFAILWLVVRLSSSRRVTPSES